MMGCLSLCFGDSAIASSSSSSSSLPPPTLVGDRAAYDAGLAKHLIQHSTPHRVELTLTAATIFLERAHHAQKVVQARKDKGCESDVALVRGPSAVERDAEQARSSFSREDAIADGLKLLRQRAAHVKVKVVHMEDDGNPSVSLDLAKQISFHSSVGNCQFRSLAQELYGDQKYHGTVRERVVARLTSHSLEYSFYIGDDDEWRRYLAKMATSRTWGDELTLRAACDEYGVVVHVVTTEHENWLLHYSPDSLAMADGRPPPGTRECFLAYVSPIHYNVIEPLDGAHAASPTGY